LVGFDPKAAVQEADTMYYLRIWDIVIPAVTALMAIWIMWKYDLTEERAKEIKSILVKRRGEL
jgi:GPH family glycoside/pentoside/hexuronide:cation symporter